MAKAALEALNGLDLFGIRGSQASVLHVLSDEIARSRITLESLLPWESSSKEVDSALLSIVGYPAFAVEDTELRDRTRRRVIEQLRGNYGCKRFLRDGHQTTVEDAGRLHYESWELQQFEHIECEWPLFYVNLYLDALFRGDEPAIDDYRHRLQSVLVEREGALLLPELYYVPADLVEAERENPHSQKRLPNANVPLVWAQSLYYLGQMLDEGLLEPGEIDPLGRRHSVGAARDPVVQIALLAEDESLQVDLEAQGVLTQTPKQIEPIQVRRAGELSLAYNQIGRNDVLGLTGRPVRRLRSLTTSKVFLIRGQQMLFLPSFLDPQKFYLMLDQEFLVAQMRSELSYIRRNWHQPGRPTITLLLTRSLLDTGQAALLELIAEMKTGLCGGVHTCLGRIGELRQASGLERIDYLHEFEFSQAPVGDSVPEQYLLGVEDAACVAISNTEDLWIQQTLDNDLLVDRLYQTRNIYEQVDILQALVERKGLSYATRQVVNGERVTVQQLLEDVYARSGRGHNYNPYWSIVRRAAALLDKTDISVSDAVTDILVRQKQITVGKSYTDASVISRPLPPSEIREMIREFGGADVRDRVLTQEVLIYLGLLIRQEPKRFRELMTLRVGYLILLMTSELAIELGIRQEEAHELLMHLSPSQIQSRVRDVLGDYDDRAHKLLRQEALLIEGGSVEVILLDKRDAVAEEPPYGSWMKYRQREGSLNRVPPGFYPSVWNLLKHCNGLIIGDKLDLRNRLDSATILAEMTAREKNFALWVEHLLNKMDAAKFRQATIEALVALSSLMEQSPTLRINDYLVLDVIVGHAVRLAWLDVHPDHTESYDEDKSAAWTAYYESSPQVCAAFVIKSLQFLTTSEVH